MAEYEFHAFAGDRAGALFTTRQLADDVQASVRTFDLMRDHANLTSIEVYRDSNLIFTRIRRAEKTAIVWTHRTRPTPAEAMARPALRQPA